MEAVQLKSWKSYLDDSGTSDKQYSTTQQSIFAQLCMKSVTTISTQSGLLPVQGWLASFLGLLRLQFLIASSMQKYCKHSKPGGVEGLGTRVGLG